MWEIVKYPDIDTGEWEKEMRLSFLFQMWSFSIQKLVRIMLQV